MMCSIPVRSRKAESSRPVRRVPIGCHRDFTYYYARRVIVTFSVLKIGYVVTNLRQAQS